MAKSFDDFILRFFEKNLKEIRLLSIVIKLIIYFAIFCFAFYVGYIAGGNVATIVGFALVFVFIIIGIFAVYAFHFYSYIDYKLFKLIVFLGGIGAFLGLIFAKIFQ